VIEQEKEFFRRSNFGGLGFFQSTPVLFFSVLRPWLRIFPSNPRRLEGIAANFPRGHSFPPFKVAVFGERGLLHVLGRGARAGGRARISYLGLFWLVLPACSRIPFPDEVDPPVSPDSGVHS